MVSATTAPPPNHHVAVTLDVKHDTSSSAAPMM